MSLGPGELDGRVMAIVGAEGFIGSWCTRIALEAGARVEALCTRAPWRLRDVSASPGLEVTVTEPWWTPDGVRAGRDALRDAEALVVLAYAPPPSRDPAAWREHEASVNVEGVWRWAELADGVEAHLVFASSADVYGPVVDGTADERRQPAPVTPYAEGKLAAERLLADRLVPGRHTSLRLATVFGPGETVPRAVPSFLRALITGSSPVVDGDGQDVHDYVGVRDVAGAIVRSAAGKATSPILNVGSGRGRTTIEVLRCSQEAVGCFTEPVHRPSPRPRASRVLAIGRAATELGFAPSHDMLGALREEARWLRAHLEAG